MPETSLGNFEELLILAVLDLKEDAYGGEVRRAVSKATNKDVSVGALYTTLTRLEEKGFLKSHEAEGDQERGGRPKKYYEVTGAGMRALQATETARQYFKPINGGLASA